jgi:hypothetical protein
MPKQLANATLFQLGLFACVFSPQHPWLLLVPLLTLALIWAAVLPLLHRLARGNHLRP